MNARNIVFFGLLPTVFGLVFIGGCTWGEKRIEPPAINASDAGEAAIAEFDTNKDGKISGAELEKVPSLKSNLAKIDTNNDKAISADEITERIKFWQDVLKTGKLPIHCNVFRNNQPLVGAEVKFVPEKFLGENMKVATGTTGPGGGCALNVPLEGPDDVPGIPPGFYRVQITKAGETIPAKYNTATTLGVDCSSDNEAVSRGIKFNLEY
ncbi:MAG: hypothetical protein JXB10_16385 [Pirellulales bacterium]|nr:hypothetical protein [Pirellulales bacterium]